MANSYRTSMHDELDDIRRLLPREILEDIGIVVDAAEQQPLDVVDVLAAHLAGVLGGSPKKTSYHHHPQANVEHGLRGGMGALASKVGAPGVAAPPFLPSPPPPVPWHVMEGLRRNTMALHPAATVPGFAAAARPPLLAGGARPRSAAAAACRGVGTGVFLPRRRTEVVRRTTAKAPARLPPSNGDHARMVQQRVQQQAAMVIVRSQQEMRAVAAHMERRCYLGVRPHAQLALPQEWTY
ncbi:unnamed protein product [Urochloa decumbens]|uniref:Uncharacterized protein n=1 Tax=Urochloa decumbens TaxID=240449 RepID=A0ABC8XBB0_9POAL